MRSLRWLASPVGAIFAAFVLGGCGGAASAPSIDALAKVRWEEQVRDCSAEHGGPGLGTVIENVFKGDATGDGRVDTLVVDECGSTTSSWPEVVEVFDGASDPGNPTRIAVLLEGDERYVRDLTVEVTPDGLIVITGSGVSETAPHCCPDLAVRDVFRFDNGGFVHVEHSQTPSPAPS